MREKIMSKAGLIALCVGSISSVCIANEDQDIDEQVEKSGAETNPLKPEKDGKPEFDIFGSAAVHFGHTSPDMTYYDGKNAPKQIKTNQKSGDESSKDSSKPMMCAGEAEVNFSAKGTLSNGWRYGAFLSLDAMKNDTGIDKAYISFERDNFGTIHAGNVRGPESNFMCGGQQLVGALFGADGAYPSDLDYATGVINPVYVLGFSNKATKIAYYTPIINGFQAGVSMTPDTKHVGHDAKDSGSGDSGLGNNPGLFIKGDKDKERPSGRNNFSIGLRHTHDFLNGWSTAFGTAFLMEDSKPIETNCYIGDVIDKKDAIGTEGQPGYEAAIEASAPVPRRLRLRNAKAFYVSGTVSYKGWSVGAGYINNGKSRLPKTEEFTTPDGKSVIPGGFLVAKDGNAGQVWNLGASYTTGRWTFAGVYNRMSRKVTEGQRTAGNIYTFAVEYLACPGLKFFGEIDQISTHSCDYACAVYNLVHEKKNAIKKQSATFIAVGAKVSF
ncbi:MAG: porin [Holosporales bacterium]|nr:porin [Holosporales bacterium]